MASTSEQLLKWREKQKTNKTVYQTKKVHFSGRATRIILQSQNGPCPLIAICNVLLLRGEFTLGANQTQVSEVELLTRVAESLFNSLNKEENSVKTVADAIDLTPSLTSGMLVDVKFTRIDDIEITKENGVFGLLGIPVVHGWLVDPKDAKTANVIGSKSYNTLMNELVDHQTKKSLGPEDVSVKKTEEDNVEVEQFEKEDTDPHVVKSSKKLKEIIAESSSKTEANSDGVISGPTSNVYEVELINNFLERNPSQLTVHGLKRLQAGLEEQGLCVFFRNNHFNTMFRYIGELYILVTDEGYMDQPGVVWERLTEVNGNTVFVNSYFMDFKPGNHEIEEIPEPDLKSVKKKDVATVMKGFEDYLEGLEGSSSLNPNVKKALELLGIDENELLFGPEVEEIPKSEEKRVKEKPDEQTVMKMFEDYLGKLIITQGNLKLSTNLKEALELLGLDEKDIHPALREKEKPGPKPEAANRGPEPEKENPSPEPRLERDYSNVRRSKSRMSPKKVKRIIKEKCYLM